MRIVQPASIASQILHNKFNVLFTNSTLKKLLTSVFLVVLASCGAGQSESDDKQLTNDISPTTTSAEFGKPASSEAVAALGKELSNYFNGQYASNPSALMGTQASENKGSAAKSLTTTSFPKNVYRFYNTRTGAHFFTVSVAERDYVKDSPSPFAYEGSAFATYTEANPSLSPVYRFYNKISGSHFYTVNASEKDHIIATWPTIFNFEGIAWYANTTPGTDLAPLYRLFNTRTGTHFYTTSATEKDHITSTWNWFVFEGIAYYVGQATPAPPECYPPSCYPPATRPIQTTSQNVFWFRTDSSKYHFLTSNQLIYSAPATVSPWTSPYDHSILFNFGGTEFFIKAGASLPPVYQTEYQHLTINSIGTYVIGLNKDASRHGGVEPAMQVNTPGRGCNSSKGAFYLHELETAPDGSLTKFAIDFNHICDGDEGANGVIRFNSEIPSVLTQIFAVAGSDFAVLEGREIPLIGNLSWSPSSKIKAARWTQISGPHLDLSQCAKLTCKTYAPLMPAGSQTATLKLTVESESGLMASDTVNVEIRSNLDKQTLLDVWGEGNVSSAVGYDLRMNDLSARMQVPKLAMQGASLPDQAIDRVHINALGKTQHGDQLHTGIDMTFMSKAGEPLVPGVYVDTGTGNGFEAYPNSPSVHVEAEGSACGHNLATMYVGDIQRNAQNFADISSLSIYSEINCIDGGLDEPTFTRLWINHQPTNVPVAHIAGATQSAAGQQITLDSSASYARKGSIVNKVWRLIFSTADAEILITGADTIALKFGANSPSGSKAIVALEAIDSSGDAGTTLHVINIP